MTRPDHEPEGDWLTELEANLQSAASALRAAWVLCKHNGMEKTAKELADTVLDVETARDIVIAERREAK